MKDLIVLVADSDQKVLIEALLRKLISIQLIDKIAFDVYKHPMRDSGNFANSPEFLRKYLKDYRSAIVILDFEGSGAEHKFGSKTYAEKDLEARLRNNRWEKCAAVIIQPEIEMWIWANFISLSFAIGWKRKEQGVDLHSWLVKNGWLSAPKNKPIRPKECYEKVLEKCKTPKSSSIFRKIAETVSFENCTDESFVKFLSILKEWFKKN
ncbi:MAG: methylation-associated defense system protein MAD4 [Bacteroidales bacterium]